MNCAEAAKKFADWADLAGKNDMPIKVNVGRSAIMREASRAGIAIAPRIKGGPLFLGDHEVIPTKEKAKEKEA